MENFNNSAFDTEIASTIQPNELGIAQHLEMIAGEAMTGHIEIAYNLRGNKAINHAERFAVEDLAEALAFAIEKNRAGSNIYTGPALRASGGKGRAGDDEALAADFLFVDIDRPTTVEEITQLYQPLRPTAVVVTGQIPHLRVHLYYKLDDPLTDQNDVRAGNRALINHFQGDPARQNPSSLMRIGGSVAWPIKKGRIPELTLFQSLDTLPKPLAAIERAYAGETPSPAQPLSNCGLSEFSKLKDGRKNYVAGLVWARRQAFYEEHGDMPTFDQLYGEVFDIARHKIACDSPGELERLVREKVEYALRPGRPAAPARKDNKVNFTEDAIAEEYAERYKGRRIYDHDQGKWMYWDKDIWRADKVGLVPDECRQLGRQLAGIEDKRLATLKTVNAVQGLARNDKRLAGSSDRWDTHPHYLGVPGGVVDLRTGALLPPDPSLAITKRTEIAPSQTVDAPLFERFLNEVTGGDVELRNYLQVAAGYACTGETVEHVLFQIFGNGGNGKSVFANTLSNIFGDYATTAPMATFTAKSFDGHPTDIASLRGARLVIASETPQGKNWNEPLIKQITGGDKIAARLMRQDFFEFKPVCKLVFLGNHMPELNNVDDAMRRRFRIIPFRFTPKTVDRQLENKLRTEWPGILRWIIQGAVEWYENGLPACPAIALASEEYFESQDLFGQWLEECCEQGPDLRDTPTNLFISYRDFALSQGQPTGSTKTLAATLKQRRFKQNRPGGKRVYVGLRARNQRTARR